MLCLRSGAAKGAFDCGMSELPRPILLLIVVLHRVEPHPPYIRRLVRTLFLETGRRVVDEKEGNRGKTSKVRNGQALRQ